MCSANFIKIYDLKNDTKHIIEVQDATLYTDKFGLKSEHGLFGTDDWWEAIKQGAIKKISVEGVISRIFMSGHNDFPEFEVVSKNGRTIWHRLGDNKYYALGKRAKIVYVNQEFKKPVPGLTVAKIPLEIYIEDSHNHETRHR
jgi:hypothetical protein